LIIAIAVKDEMKQPSRPTSWESKVLCGIVRRPVLLVLSSLSPRPLCGLISHGGLFSIMDFELYPTITLRPRSFSALLAPREMFIQALNRNLNLQRYKVLYVTGNYSGILTHLSRRFTELEIRRGFTVFQLMTILEQARHSLILIEHDPLLYADAREMIEYVSQSMRQAAQESAVLLYSPGADPFLEELVQNADRVWYFDEEPRAEKRIISKSNPRTHRSQKTLEAFS
jgi:hypothetical protein